MRFILVAILAFSMCVMMTSAKVTFLGKSAAPVVKQQPMKKHGRHLKIHYGKPVEKNGDIGSQKSPHRDLTHHKNGKKSLRKPKKNH